MRPPQVKNYTSVRLDRVAHVALTEPFPVFGFDFDADLDDPSSTAEYCRETVLNATATREGIANAVVFWFTLTLNRGEDDAIADICTYPAMAERCGAEGEQPVLERSGAVCGIRRGEVGGNLVGQGSARPDESSLRRAHAKRRVELPSVSMITTHAFFFPCLRRVSSCAARTRGGTASIREEDTRRAVPGETRIVKRRVKRVGHL